MTPLVVGAQIVTLRFTIEDTGTGLTQAQLAKIFLPFEQVGDAQQRSGGVGLGLAITMHLVNAMNGTLGVQSEWQQGSTFRLDLTLPAKWTSSNYAPVSVVRRGDEHFVNGDQAVPQKLWLDDAAAKLAPPPPAEISVLLDLALKGELSTLRKRAAQLAVQNPTYAPFAAHLRQLAEQFEEERILALIEQVHAEQGEAQ